MFWQRLRGRTNVGMSSAQDGRCVGQASGVGEDRGVRGVAWSLLVVIGASEDIAVGLGGVIDTYKKPTFFMMSTTNALIFVKKLHRHN